MHAHAHLQQAISHTHPVTLADLPTWLQSGLHLPWGPLTYVHVVLTVEANTVLAGASHGPGLYI